MMASDNDKKSGTKIEDAIKEVNEAVKGDDPEDIRDRKSVV